MKRIVALIAATVAFVAAQPTTKPKPPPAKAAAPWPKEPDGFNVAKFGMSEQQITELFTVDGCYISNTDTRYCRANLDVGDRSWGLRFEFIDDHLVKISGDFASDTFQEVRAGFLSKYGPPSGRWNSVVRTRVGVQYQQEDLMWSGKKVDFILSKYGDDVDSGWFVVSLKGINERDAARRKTAIQNAIK